MEKRSDRNKKSRKDKKSLNKKKSSKGKKFLISIIVLLLIVVSGFGIYFKFLTSKFDRVKIDRSDITNVGKDIPKEAKDITTIALFGTDYSGDDTGTIGAADSMMILAIDDKNDKIKLGSLMRDMYVDVPGSKKSNLNYTMNDGGPALTLKTINYNFNLQVDKFIQVDLRELPKIIDSLGGVTMDITNEELNFINNYIKGIDKKNGSNTKLIKNPGTQVLNGTQAAAYCRIRYTDGIDYRRTERQRDVLTALFNKISKQSMSELPRTISNILPLVSTNITDGEILSIATKTLGIKDKTVVQGRFPLDGDSRYEYTDMYHMITDIPKTTEELHKFLFSK